MAIRLCFATPAGYGHTNIDCGSVHGGRSHLLEGFGGEYVNLLCERREGTEAIEGAGSRRRHGG